MPTALHWTYAAYLLWLLAGLLDFALHRRTDLPHTSGVPESTAHAVQLGILGSAIVAGLAFEPGPGVATLLALAVAAHACVGYFDSRVAFSRGRTLYPAEQHVHSILDMAPAIALGLWLAWNWAAATSGDWLPRLRRPPLPPLYWIAMIVPALALCVVPAALEFRAAWRARREPGRAPPRTHAAR